MSEINNNFYELQQDVQAIKLKNKSQMILNQHKAFKYLYTLKSPNEIIDSQVALDVLNSTYKNCTCSEFSHLASEISTISLQYDFPAISSSLCEILIIKLEKLYKEEADIITEILTESFIKIALTTIRIINELIKASAEFTNEFIRNNGLESILKPAKSEVLVQQYLKISNRADSVLELLFKNVVNVLVKLNEIPCAGDLFINLGEFYKEITNEDVCVDQSVKTMVFMTLFFANRNQEFSTEEHSCLENPTGTVLSSLKNIISQFNFNSTRSNCIFKAKVNDEPEPTEWNLLDILRILYSFFNEDRVKFANTVNDETFNHLKSHTNLKIQEYLKLFEELAEKAPISGSYKSNKHIIISYHDYDRVLCRQIKCELEGLNFKVCMNDVDLKNPQSNLDNMAKSIEECLCFLMCVSDLYQDCPVGRAEAEYAFSRGKPIIPLIMQKDYKPSGWLGIIMGTKIFVNFTKYEYEDCVRRLLNEINPVLELESSDSKIKSTVDSTVAIKRNDEQDSGLKVFFNEILEWSSEDLDDWLSNKPTSEFTRRHLKMCTGEELHEILLIKHEAPEFFYSFLATKMKVFCLRDILEFAFELEILFNENI